MFGDGSQCSRPCRLSKQRHHRRGAAARAVKDWPVFSDQAGSLLRMPVRDRGPESETNLPTNAQNVQVFPGTHWVSEFSGNAELI